MFLAKVSGEEAMMMTMIIFKN